jgi:hypothetical protein
MARKKQVISETPPSSQDLQTLDGDGVAERPTKTTTTKNPSGKRIRPTYVEASKPVSSPQKKKKKGSARQPKAANEDPTSDVDAPAPPEPPRPRPRRKGVAVTKTAQAIENDTAGRASGPQGKGLQGKGPKVSNEKQQLLADALVDEDAREAAVEENTKKRGEMARHLFAEQSLAADSSAEDSSEDSLEDSLEDSPEDEPQPKDSGVHKVCEHYIVPDTNFYIPLSSPSPKQSRSAVRHFALQWI